MRFYGPPDLIHYMQTVYTPFHKEHSKTVNMTLVYEKKGTTGMAGQLFGVCDTLLLGILHNRVVKSILLQIGLKLVVAPSLPSKLFNFPFSNFPFSVKDKRLVSMLSNPSFIRI